MNISVVIPYEYHQDRVKLFDACLKSLRASLDCEICIHETGPKSTLDSSLFDKYLHTATNHVFDRAWSINVGIRHLATKEYIIASDADLLFPKEWGKEMEAVVDTEPDGIYFGFGKLFDLTEEATNKFLTTGQLELNDNGIRRIRTEAQGGVTLMPRKVVELVCGIPEDFSGTWGGEDSAFTLKLKAYGVPINRVESPICHFYHEATTVRKKEKLVFLINKMRRWGINAWKHHTNLSQNWGDLAGNCMKKEYRNNNLYTYSY